MNLKDVFQITDSAWGMQGRDDAPSSTRAIGAAEAPTLPGPGQRLEKLDDPMGSE
jgi:hypothetical protein